MKNLESAMKRFGVSFLDIVDLLGCTERTLKNKMNGVTGFTFDEVKKIRDNLFPGMGIEYLFNAEEQSTSPKKAS